uniref:Putative secreted protein n=1 Tax=Anopheles darlingi TaxID=43151 RepID=A0A2M4DB45_ANODA
MCTISKVLLLFLFNRIIVPPWHGDLQNVIPVSHSRYGRCEKVGHCARWMAYPGYFQFSVAFLGNKWCIRLTRRQED